MRTLLYEAANVMLTRYNGQLYFNLAHPLGAPGPWQIDRTLRCRNLSDNPIPARSAKK